MQKMGDINGVFGRFFRMVLVAQLARASGCGPEGRRFEPDRAHPPFACNSNELRAFLLPAPKKRGQRWAASASPVGGRPVERGTVEEERADHAGEENASGVDVSGRYRGLPILRRDVVRAIGIQQFLPGGEGVLKTEKHIESGVWIEALQPIVVLEMEAS